MTHRSSGVQRLRLSLVRAAALLLLCCGVGAVAAEEGDGGTMWLLDAGRVAEPSVAAGARPAWIDFAPVAASAHQFIPQGQAEIAGAIVKRGARLNAEDDEGRTPLCWAVFYDEEKIARTRFDNGARLGRLLVELPENLR